jgi:anti-sigma regulatory factor (Ser/Thr protein kinase)
MPEYQFQYPSTLDSEDKMLNDLERVFAQNRVCGEVVHRLMLIVSEAFTNALLHGNQENPSLIISVHLQVNEMMIVADITDQGKGGLDRIKHRCNSDDLMEEHGRGIDLIKHYADDVKYSESVSGGLIVSITVLRKEKVARF